MGPAAQRELPGRTAGALIALALVLLLDAIILFAFWADPPFTTELVGQSGLVRSFLALPAAVLLLPLVLLRTRSLLRQAMHDEDGQGASLLTLELVVHMLSALLAASVFLDGLA